MTNKRAQTDGFCRANMGDPQRCWDLPDVILGGENLFRWGYDFGAGIKNQVPTMLVEPNHWVVTIYLSEYI